MGKGLNRIIELGAIGIDECQYLLEKNDEWKLLEEKQKSETDRLKKEAFDKLNKLTDNELLELNYKAKHKVVSLKQN